MRQVLENTLSLGAKNSVVHAFKKLVYHSLGMTFKSEDKNASNDSSIPPRYIAELDKDLYSKAVSLPEAATVSLDSDIDDKLKYGEFSGGSVYKTLDGDIDENNKDVRAQEGWLILDRSSNDYAIFVAESDTYIIAIKSFTPKPIVKDFMPLYIKLNESIRHSHSTVEDSIKADTKFTDSLAVTYRYDVSDIVTSYTEQEYTNTASDSAFVYNSSGSGGSSGGSGRTPRDKFSLEFPMLSVISSDLKVQIYKAWLLYMQAVLLYGDFIFFGLSLKDRINKLKNAEWDAYKQEKIKQNYESEFNKDGYYGVYPGQIGPVPQAARSNDAINEVQTVIYVLDPSTSDLKAPSNSYYFDDNNSAVGVLYCFQTPESIGYNVQSSYETVTTRGTQQPLQYYNQANQVDLSFTLKWHIDEVKSLQNGAGVSYSLQDIARISEWYTRPWDTGGGNRGKLCKVILPSIARVGYITSANISYSGDMYGDVVGSINKDRKMDNGSGNNYAEYGYNVLEVTFTMVVVQDIDLTMMSSWEDYQYGEPALETNSFSDTFKDKAKDLLVRGDGKTDQGLSTAYYDREIDYSDNLGAYALGASNALEIAKLSADIATAGIDLAKAEVNMANAAADFFNI